MNEYVYDSNSVLKLGGTLDSQENTIIFQVGSYKEFLKLCPNGDIILKGNIVENDLDIVDGMREMITNYKTEYHLQDSLLAVKLSEVVHKRCKDVPHDIGIELLKTFKGVL